jgi:hypothetical protein
MGMVLKMQTHVAVQLFTDMDFLRDPSSSDVIYQTLNLSFPRLGSLGASCVKS